MKLKISVGSKRDNEYSNKVNGYNYKELALIFRDLNSLGFPVEEAFKEMKRMNKTDWDVLVGNN